MALGVAHGFDYGQILIIGTNQTAPREKIHQTNNEINKIIKKKKSSLSLSLPLSLEQEQKIKKKNRIQLTKKKRKFGIQTNYH